MEKKYAKAYTEVLELLKHIPKEEYNRIPETEIQFYENNCDKNYKFIYDETIELKEQKISKEANAVIIAMYMNYFANEKQKEIIDEVLKQNSINQEKEKKQKYNTENIFKEENQENLPIELNKKKENIIKRIINKIKGLFAKTV